MIWRVVMWCSVGVGVGVVFCFVIWCVVMCCDVMLFGVTFVVWCDVL